MFIELEVDDYHIATPLFRAVDYSQSLPAVVAGNSPGRVFVDDLQNPKVAFALTVEGYFLAGDPNDAPTVEATGYFLREKIFSGDIYLDDATNLSLAITPSKWEAKLPKMIPTHEIEKLPRFHYLCQKLRFDWRDQLPSGFQICPFDQVHFNDSSLVIPEAIHDWANIEILWGSVENFMKHGVSTCVLDGNKVVAICQSDCYYEDQIDIGIFTLPDYRNKGLAAAATAANVEAAFEKGYRKVGWHCNADNIGSWKTAEKVGFKRLKQYYYYFYIFDEIDHLAELGWFFFKQGQYTDTINFYERVFAAREDNPDYYYHLTAVAWAALGNAGMSIRYLQAAVDHGWRAGDWTEREEKFKFLHGSPEFKAVLKRMGKQ